MKYPGVIKKGSTNASAIKAIKERLNCLLGSTLDTSNVNFGESTDTVVKQFQKKYQLIQDGIIGELSWKHLFEQAKPVPVGSLKSLSLVALDFFNTQLFVREATGKNDGLQVEAYLKAIGLGKGYAWCMAFMFYGFDAAAKQLKTENPLIKTGGVLRQWNEQPASKKFKTPKVGDIFIMDFGKGTGHCGIVEHIVGDRIHTIEGNTSADPTLPTEDREGNGVFERSRKISSINKGFLRF